MPIRNVLSVLAILFLFLAVPLHAQEKKVVFERLLEKYDAVEGLRATFTYTMSSDFWDDDQVFAGHLVLWGNQYRVETDTELLLVTEESTYLYRPDNNQVLISNANEAMRALTPSTLLFNDSEQFDVIGMDRTPYHYGLILQPKDDNSLFDEITVWVRENDDTITRLSILDTNGTKIHLSLTDIVLNPRIESDTFLFSPPSGVEIIDLRS